MIYSMDLGKCNGKMDKRIKEYFNSDKNQNLDYDLI